MEAATGFEPVYNGFADRRLTSWLCRLYILGRIGPSIFLTKMEQETGFEPAAITLAT